MFVPVNSTSTSRIPKMRQGLHSEPGVRAYLLRRREETLESDLIHIRALLLGPWRPEVKMLKLLVSKVSSPVKCVHNAPEGRWEDSMREHVWNRRDFLHFAGIKSQVLPAQRAQPNRGPFGQIGASQGASLE